MTEAALAGLAAGRVAFLAALHEGCEGLCELRALPSAARAFVVPGDVAGVEAFVSRVATENIYMAVATRADASSGALENCHHLGALYADVDFKVTPQADARERLARFRLPLSACIHSGGGLHAYWFLREPFDLRDAAACAEARQLLRRLAVAVGGDMAAAEPARVLRLPGTFNRKSEYGAPRPVKLEILEPGRRYNPSDLDEVLPPEPEATTDAGPFVLPDRIPAHEPGRNHTLWRYGRSLKARGWKLLRILEELERANAERCEPPLPADELSDVAHNVMTEADRPTFTTRSNGHHGAELATERPHRTDAGNAVRFVQRHGARVRYCWPWRSWLFYDGTRWKRDADAEVMALAKESALANWPERAQARDDKERREITAWLTRSESEPGLRRMLELVKSEPGIPVGPADLDRDPYLLNFPNGTLELRTGHLRPHRHEDLITRITAVPAQPDARHPVFDAFLERVLPDEDLRAFVQRVAGYCCTGSTAEEKLFLMYGPTAGGKSTFLTALRRALGDYATTAAAETFMDRKADGGAPRDDLVKLIGRRLVVSSEVKDGSRLAEALVKTLFGGDDLSARGLYERTTEFTPVCKVVIAANHRPRVRDDDDALWRRLLEIPFDQSIPEAERDPAVKSVLCDPVQAGAAVLSWAMDGAAQWFERGLGIPAAVKRATAAYRQAMDPLTGFLDECCVFAREAAVTTSELRGAYAAWAKENSLRFPLGARAFADRLRGRGCDQAKRTGGERWWLGIRLRGPLDPDPPSGASGASGAMVGTPSYARAYETTSEPRATSATGATRDSLPDWVEHSPDEAEL